MDYRGLMGYGVQFPAHRVGGPKKLWDLRIYGLSKAWVMRVPRGPKDFKNCPGSISNVERLSESKNPTPVTIR